MCISGWHWLRGECVYGVFGVLFGRPCVHTAHSTRLSCVASWEEDDNRLVMMCRSGLLVYILRYEWCSLLLSLWTLSWGSECCLFSSYNPSRFFTSSTPNVNDVYSETHRDTLLSMVIIKGEINTDGGAPAAAAPQAAWTRCYWDHTEQAAQPTVTNPIQDIRPSVNTPFTGLCWQRVGLLLQSHMLVWLFLKEKAASVWQLRTRVWTVNLKRL